MALSSVLALSTSAWRWARPMKAIVMEIRRTRMPTTTSSSTSVKPRRAAAGSAAERGDVVLGAISAVLASADEDVLVLGDGNPVGRRQRIGAQRGVAEVAVRRSGVFTLHGVGAAAGDAQPAALTASGTFVALD